MKNLIFVLIILFTFQPVFSMEDSIRKIDTKFEKGIVYTLIDISDFSNEDLNRLKSEDTIVNWCELDNKILVSHFENKRLEFPKASKSIEKPWLFKTLSKPFIAIVRTFNSPLKKYENHINVLAEKGSYIVFQAPFAVIEKLYEKRNNHFHIEPFDQNLSLLVNNSRIETKRVKIEGNINVSKERLANYIKKLEEFKTRYTYVSKYVDSAKWCKSEFEKMGLKSKLVAYKDYSPDQYNVVAQKDMNYNGEFYIICAHLDSTSPNARVNAPGADDNASGCAGVLELAELFKNTPGAEKIRYVLYGGEEAGLKGSKAYVKQLKASGELKNCLGVVNLDMIGFDKKSPLSSLIETKTFSKEFMEKFANTAKQLGQPAYTISYRPWGSDHVPFLNEKVPCFLFIEDEFAANPNYHQITDKLGSVNMNLVEAIVKVVAETMAVLIK